MGKWMLMRMIMVYCWVIGGQIQITQFVTK